MSCSDSDDSDLEWIPFHERQEWKDVTPLKQEEGPTPVVSIAYSQKFKDVYDYVRAIMKAEEMSERALELTKEAILLNPANYSVWQYRRMILKTLKTNLENELEFTNWIIRKYPKNYQVWHHRMVIVELMDDPSNELEFLEQAMKQDAKNYHAWKHRQWVLKKYNLFDNELSYTESLIDNDVRNNSAWNQRYFVLNYTSKLSDKEALEKEITFTLENILKATLNESPWSYLRGILIHMDEGLLEPNVLQFCKNLYANKNNSPHLYGYLVDACAEAIDAGKTDDPFLTLESGIKYCKELGENIDTIRVKYWNYMIDILNAKEADKNITLNGTNVC